MNREAGLDLRPFAEVPAPGQTSPPATTTTKNLYGTKNNCAHAQLGQNYDRGYTINQKIPIAIFEEPEAKVSCQEEKQGTVHDPSHSTS